MLPSRAKSALRFALVTILVALCGFITAFGEKTQLSDATYVAFTAHIVEENFASGAALQPVDVHDITFARRSDGSEVTSTSVHSPDKLQVDRIVDILDVNSSKQIALEPFTKSSMTFYLSPKELNQTLDSRHCPANVDELGEHSKILDYDVVRDRDRWGSDSKSTDDEWLAPSLACFTLKEIFAVSWGGWNRRTVVSLTEGEPPSSMFDIPPEYVERSPSEMVVKWSDTFPGSKYLPDSSIRNMDQQYYRQRPGP
jgi:hypothetical protein